MVAKKKFFVNTSLGTTFTTVNFLETYEWAQKAKVVVLVKPFQLSVMQKASVLGPFIVEQVSQKKIKFISEDKTHKRYNYLQR